MLEHAARGRIALVLAEKGLDITGVDISNVWVRLFEPISTTSTRFAVISGATLKSTPTVSRVPKILARWPQDGSYLRHTGRAADAVAREAPTPIRSEIGSPRFSHSSPLPPPIGRRLLLLFKHLSCCCFRLIQELLLMLFVVAPKKDG